MSSLKHSILAIDSSTEACSVALSFNGKQFNRFQLAPRKHAELLLPMVDEVLSEANCQLTDLDAIACCVGPGAFTGLRIAISVAQSLAYASRLPCIAVSSLEAMAVDAFVNTKAEICLSSIDARMQEVYFCAFKRGDNDQPMALNDEEVAASDQLGFNLSLLTTQTGEDLSSLSELSYVKAGSGWAEYQYSKELQQIDSICDSVAFPNAKYLLQSAQNYYNENKLLKPEFLQPVYLRNNVAKKKSEQK